MRLSTPSSIKYNNKQTQKNGYLQHTKEEIKEKEKLAHI